MDRVEALAAEAVAMVVGEEGMEGTTTAIPLIVLSTVHIIISDKNFTLQLFSCSVKKITRSVELYDTV
jgi:hypothetical protein